ncbi:ComEC/Rec2 family competence protein [Candidatus Daviesbacteria bacterium]|nr:ComEC/Rec2 family competence protein [Candidatus Daviesbacteria bacterium]
MKGKLPILLTLVLFCLIYILRLNQGGFEFELNVFSEQRHYLDEKISTLLPSPQAELLSGIILGNKKDLPTNLRLNLRDTSTLHIVVVSGQNLTLVSAVVMFLLCGVLHKRWAILVSAGVIIFYTLLTGAQVPVVRAAVMAILSLSAAAFGRQKESVWILFITAGMMLLVNPVWLFDLSFQLSFLATFGVLSVAPVINNALEKVFPKVVSQDLSITTAAQIMVSPLIIQVFHQFSIVGIVANLMVGWSIPFIMILGLIMILVSFLSAGFSSIIALFVSLLLSFFIKTVDFFASLPFAWEYIGEKSWVFWVGYYLILAGVMIAINKKAMSD